MPLTRIRQTAIGNDSITTAKLDDTSGGLTLPGIEYVHVPVGTTAQRPSSPVNGYMRYNTNFERLEQYAGGAWIAIDTPPAITSLSYPGSVTAADPAGGETITLTGTNFQSGLNITVGGTAAASVTFVSSTQVTFTTPVKTAGDYDVVVTNSNGLSATLTNGISYNGVPSFTTLADLGSISGGEVMSTITIVATEPDSGTVSYSVTTNSVPPGTSFNGTTGEITGTPTAPSASQDYNFTITATDDESQTNTRNFTLRVVRPVYAYQLNGEAIRFQGGNSRLERTMVTADRTKWTLSWWQKATDRFNFSELFSSAASTHAGGADITYVGYNPTNENVTWSLYTTYGGGSAEQNVQTAGPNIEAGTGGTGGAGRDHQTWTHVCIAFDSSETTDSDRVKFWVNGVRQTLTDGSGGSPTWPDLNTGTTYFGVGNYKFVIAEEDVRSRYPWEGYMCEIHFAQDGTNVYDETDFGEYYNGVWVPKEVSGISYGSNGFYLKGNITDHSGNNNNFTNQGAALAVQEAPTIDFANLNDLTRPSGTRVDGGNLFIVSQTTHHSTMATHCISKGMKSYFEIYVHDHSSTRSGWLGLDINPRRATDYTGSGRVGFYDNNNNFIMYGGSNYTFNNVGSGTGAPGTMGGTYTIFMFAVDYDNGKIWMGADGQWFTTIGSLTRAAFDENSPITTFDSSDVWAHKFLAPFATGNMDYGFNFGQDRTFGGRKSGSSGYQDSNGDGDFYYQPPSGFVSIASKNMGEPTFSPKNGEEPKKHFDVINYSGNGSTQNITSLNFQPDLLMVKERDNSFNWAWMDSVRGVNQIISPSLTNYVSVPGVNAGNGEVTDAGGVTAFNSNGFSLSGDGTFYVNRNNENYLAWAFKAGGNSDTFNIDGTGYSTASAASLDGGSITPLGASVGTNEGISIIKYQGNGSTGQSIKHGLGVTPHAIIIKALDLTYNWDAYWVNVTGTGNRLSPSADVGLQTTQANMWGTIDDSVFTVGGASYNNNSSSEYIAYLFTSKPGFSDIGTYTGNGNSGNDGQFVYTGFMPAWVLVKRADTTSGYDWHQYINIRSSNGGANPIDMNTYWNLTNGEGNPTDRDIDFLANGFNIRGNNANVNTNNINYAYMAFADTTQKYNQGRI